jgi:hypothetical protein
MQHMHQHDQQWYDPLHIITWLIDLDFTCSSLFLRSIKPSHILIFSTLITWLNVMSHVQWAPSSYMWALQHFQAISSSWQVLLTHMYLWTNHLCISLQTQLVHLRLSLNYQNQIRTFQSCRAVFGRWAAILVVTARWCCLVHAAWRGVGV